MHQSFQPGHIFSDVADVFEKMSALISWIILPMNKHHFEDLSGLSDIIQGSFPK